VRDKKHVVRSDHADGLPARFAIDLAVLRGYVVGIVEHKQCGIEAEAMLTPVEPILPRVPGEFHGDSRIYGAVYTLIVFGPRRKQEFVRDANFAMRAPDVGLQNSQLIEKKRVPFGYVSGEYLDDAVNNERTEFLVSKEDDLVEESGWDSFVTAASSEAGKFLQPYTEPVRIAKEERIRNYVGEQQ
jgi:hypothetical protein